MNEMKVVIKSVVKEELEGETYQTESVQDQTTAIADKVRSNTTIDSCSSSTATTAAAAAAAAPPPPTHSPPSSPPSEQTNERTNNCAPIDTKQAAGPTEASV